MLEVQGNNDGDWNIKVLGSVTIHQSMCYGSDIQPQLTDHKSSLTTERVYVSTSFYDKLLCVWR